MKLLLISVQNAAARGGIAVWTDHFLSGCGQHNLECALVNTKMVGKRAASGGTKRNLYDEILRTCGIFRELNRKLKSGGFDVAHLNTSCGDFGLFRDYLIARKIARKGIAVVVHYHCDIPYWIKNPLSYHCLKKLATLSHKNLVLCENSRKYLSEQFGVEAVKVPNFIQTHLVAGSPKNISDQLHKVFFAGRVSVAKGAKEMYALAERFPEITFALAGDVSEEVAAWKKPENLHLLGGMSPKEIIEHLDGADVFLFPSHSEGFSVALLESMARGVPAIATDVGAAADMLSDGCGILVEKGDVEAMASAICALSAAETRRQISCKVVNKVKNCYTVDVVIEQIKRQYE